MLYNSADPLVMRACLEPHTPPIQSADLAPVGGRIGPEPDDFQVEELPLYAPSGSGDHLYVRVKKRGATTAEAVRSIARAAGVDDRAVGTAGMKDKHAVTIQWMSVPVTGATGPDGWTLDSRFEILEVSRHGNKLRTGHLRGNRFRIRLVGVDADAAGRAEAITSHLEGGVVNYFGSQRFGRGGQNLARALDALDAPSNRRLSRFDRKLFPSVIQAEVFNRYATARVALGLSRVVPGEVLRLAGSGSVFETEDVERETRRWLERDVVPTGPIVGPRMRAASATAARLEDDALAELGLGRDSLRPFGKLAAGTRRDLVVYPEGLSVRPAGDSALLVEFSLPPGSYATQVLRELTRAPFLSGSR